MVHENKEYSIVKEVGDPFSLFATSRFTISWKRKHRVLLGHNRWATVGKVNRLNAHPFETENLIGVHNGTLKNKHAIPDSQFYDTDSEALYNNIDFEGLEKAMSIVRGAWALAYYNKEDHSMNFLRNAERPLFIGTNEENDCIIWASELWMIQVAASREALGKIKAKELPVDTWYKYRLPEGILPFRDAEKQKIKGAEEEKKVIGVVTKPGNSGTSASTPLLPNKSGKEVEVVGIKSHVNAHGVSYCEMINADGTGDDVYHVYGTPNEVSQYLLGVWKGTVAYTVNEIKGNVVNSYHKLNSNTMFKPVTKKDFRGIPVPKSIFHLSSRLNKCCNCSSNIQYEENWMQITSDDTLCSECNSQQIVNMYYTLLKGEQNATTQ